MTADEACALLESGGAAARAFGLTPLVLRETAPQGCVSGTALLGEGLAPALAVYGARYPGGDPRAAASEWTKAYFRNVLPLLVAPAFVGVCIAAAPDDVWVRLDGGGPTAAFLRDPCVVRAAPGGPVPAGGDLERLYATLLGRHVAAVVTAVGAASGLAPRVVWSNAGALLAFVYRTAAGRPELAAAARHDAAVLGAAEVPWFDGRNPLFEPVRAIPVGIPGLPPVAHVRRVCCLRDRLGEPLCLSCPRVGQEERAARYLAALRTRGEET